MDNNEDDEIDQELMAPISDLYRRPRVIEEDPVVCNLHSRHLYLVLTFLSFRPAPFLSQPMP